MFFYFFLTFLLPWEKWRSNYPTYIHVNGCLRVLREHVLLWRCEGVRRPSVGRKVLKRVQASISSTQCEWCIRWRTLFAEVRDSTSKGPTRETESFPCIGNKVAHWINLVLQGVVLGFISVRWPYIISSEMEHRLYLYQSGHQRQYSSLVFLSFGCLA